MVRWRCADAAARRGSSRRPGDYEQAGGGGFGRERARSWRDEAASLAAVFGQAGAIRVLVEVRAELEARAADGVTALHWAAGNGQIESVKTLAELGADKEAAGANGSTSTPLIACGGMGGACDSGEGAGRAGSGQGGINCCWINTVALGGKAGAFSSRQDDG